MNKNEIKKALKFCADINDCDNCPYDVVRSCSDRLKLDARELIAEQEKEIERLKDDYAKLQELFAQYQMASDKEIIAQKKEAEKRFENNMKAVLEIEKKQAVKDFAEKIKSKLFAIFGKTMCSDLDTEDITDIIDELLKEYE